MTKEEALAYQANWNYVNEFMLEEQRATPLDVKWKQFVTIFSKTPRTEEALLEIRQVQDSWCRLKDKCYG